MRSRRGVNTEEIPWLGGAASRVHEFVLACDCCPKGGDSCPSLSAADIVVSKRVLAGQWQGQNGFAAALVMVAQDECTGLLGQTAGDGQTQSRAARLA